MYEYKYPHPAVTTDSVVFRKHEDRLQVLLIQRKNEPYKGCWAFPGGFLEENETLEECAVRELMEETTLKGVRLTQFHAFSDPKRDERERVISVAFWGVMENDAEVKGEDDAARAQWFDAETLPPLAFDHREMFILAKKEYERENR